MKKRTRFDGVEFSFDYLQENKVDRGGVYSFVSYNPAIEHHLDKRYGKSGLCLKVFKQQVDSVYEATWGENPLFGCTVIQNLMARIGYAPRVYDIVMVDCVYPAQVTDFLTGRVGEIPEYRDEIVAVRKRSHIDTRWDMNPKNFFGGKLVDFQPWYFYDEEAYRKTLTDSAYQYAAWGSRSEPYQAIDELGFPGQRDQDSRAELMALGDLASLDVLDIGCNLGAMCVEAWELGARQVVGLDKPEVAEIAFEITNYLGYWALDFVGLNLPEEKDQIEGVFDVVFVLSSNQTKPIPWAFDLCREVLYFEGHVPDQEHTYRETLEDHFRKVEFLGTTRDHGPRPLFRCEK